MSTVIVNQMEAVKTFLNNEVAVKGFRVNEVKQSKVAGNNADLDTFRLRMTTAQHINEGITWFNSEQGITERKLDGMILKVYQLGEEAYGIKKAQFYLYNNCYKAHLENKNILKDYVSYVACEIKQDNNVSYSLKGFKKYIEEDSNPTEAEDKETFVKSLSDGKGKDAIRCRQSTTGRIDYQGNSANDVLNSAEKLVDDIKAQMLADAKSKGKAPISEGGKELLKAINKTKAKAKAKVSK
jgi:hypothetical protein